MDRRHIQLAAAAEPAPAEPAASSTTNAARGKCERGFSSREPASAYIGAKQLYADRVGGCWRDHFDGCGMLYGVVYVRKSEEEADYSTEKTEAATSAGSGGEARTVSVKAYIEISCLISKEDGGSRVY